MNGITGKDKFNLLRLWIQVLYFDRKNMKNMRKKRLSQSVGVQK